ncbi:hypothetical protein IE81DRAFT_345671 [Ceraceosorus guamensis]|uniref:Uncharacterized protein n=1 Tax=Ceraceosorus guamensis TaxID=1522189 RepID=A0A316W422_9BASI|nr:hypothetical protein IE81DRAFT_345671 [Ceraceosorus guamensis]PWN44442.1 hypothetical protein IE81DRAFT_345671 [Ceraceosorus guamensis]
MDNIQFALLCALSALVLALGREAWKWSRLQRTIPVPALPVGYRAWSLPDPEPGFELKMAEDLALRPFRWGKHRLTMGIKPLNPTQWLSLHKSYPAYIRLREARHAVYGSRCYKILPSSACLREGDFLNELAALELARAISAYLACRYPSLFRVEPRGSERRNDGFDVRSITRNALPECGLEAKTWLLEDLGPFGEGADEAMRVAGELVPDDLALLRETPLTDEERAGYQSEKAPLNAHRLIGGSICTAGFWTLKDKLGLPLREIHTRGGVPQYDEKLRDPMDRFFSKLRPDKPIERIDNFFFQICDTEAIPALLSGELIPDVLPPDDKRCAPISGRTSSSMRADELCRELYDRSELSWSHTTNGPEEIFDQMLKGPRAASSETTGRVDAKSDAALDCKAKEEEEEVVVVDAFKGPQVATDPASICMRAERQTLRRLPRSGAIVFTIRTYLTPITEFAKEAGVPGRLASSMREWPEATAKYKGAEMYRDLALRYLDEAHRDQIDAGLIRDWEIDAAAFETERARADKAFPFA